MKKFAFILLISTILASCAGKKDKYTINGIIKGVDTGMIYLQKDDGDHWVSIDSTRLEKGSFIFKGGVDIKKYSYPKRFFYFFSYKSNEKADIPEMMHIAMPDNQILLPVFVENSKIEVQIYSDSLEKSTVKGSATHDFYQQYLTMNESLNKKMDEVNMQWKKAKDTHDSATMKRTDSISTELDKEMKKQLVAFVKTNNKTVVSPYLVFRNSWQFELPDLEEIMTAMDTNLNNSQYTLALKKRVAILKNVAIGEMAPDFTMNDSTGKPVTLSSFKGKIMLLDFWASWCGPCRAENPNVVKAFQAFNKKGFDVLGCSFDRNREKWLKAVRDDKLSWNHVSDLKLWGNAAGKLYGVNSIPANVLLDKDQMIIGRNLRGEDLMKKLTEILGPAIAEKKANGSKSKR